MLGLEEEPQSPPTVRGGDTSLFSLPSESGFYNDSTPHTSNVSMTTTITTIVSPTKRGQRLQRLQEGSDKEYNGSTNLKNTIESLVVLLGRLEAACLLLMSVKGKVKAAEEINQIYLEFMGLSLTDLKKIINFFELTCSDPPRSVMARTVSEDPDLDGVRRPTTTTTDIYRVQDSHQVQTTGESQEILRINIVENDVGDKEYQQEVECDLWTPNSDDMNSYHPLVDDDEENNGTNNNNNNNNDHDEPIDDLRRTVGSFDLESVQEEREGVPSWDDDDNDREGLDNEPGSFRANLVGRRQAAGTAAAGSRRFRKGRFWRRRFLGGRNGRQATAE